MATRRARVKAFAKLNLCLEVLGRRSDGFHELRTVFQTISLADTIEAEFTPSRRTDAVLESDLDIPDNLVLRAARAVLDATNAKGIARFRLVKRIPMGGGMGGGSSDAAAVLLALPALTGKPLKWNQLLDIAARLGSDVPFFLIGGTALGLGRGTELYPIAEAKAAHVLVVAPGIHVSTPEAYNALGRPLLSEAPPRSNVAQQLAMNLSDGVDWHRFAVNDFEPAVFQRHPELKRIKAKLARLGAKPALMSGSGSSVFGIFSSVSDLRTAASAFKEHTVYPVSFLSRSRYHVANRRQDVPD
ncbi:MAG TPA: 4-(cytidine 5'-diphospho)-2-C-methyl-D-erythritol kinase [Bryobacteraceae bacterium]|nr:4-(cytidine 5'-diphospho)-2-C-methyl-D-erythritol kinase [Bryobacteraceae bacterium]